MKILCSQCHNSAFANPHRQGLVLYCQHLKKFLPAYHKINNCNAVIYEDKERFLSGEWDAPSFNPYTKKDKRK